MEDFANSRIIAASCGVVSVVVVVVVVVVVEDTIHIIRISIMQFGLEGNDISNMQARHNCNVL